MTFRTGTIIRVMVSILVAALVVWIALIGQFYRTGQWNDALLIAPDRLAAIAAVVDRTPASGRVELIAALSSDVVAVDVRHDLTVQAEFADLPAFATVGVGDYDRALGGRAFSIERTLYPGWALQTSRANRMMAQGLEFRVALSGGETLLLFTRSPMMFNVMGLPFGFGAGLLGTLLALCVLLMVSRAVRPLRQLAEAVDSMDLAAEAPPPMPKFRGFSPEIAKLIDAYNRLHARLSTVMQNRIALVGGVSHDVRTFATRLRLKVDLIPSEQERESAIADIRDMIQLLDDSLLGSRAAAGELSEELIELDEFLARETHELARAGKTIVFDETSEIPVPVLADRLALRRIVANLIDNAVTYGRSARVSVVRQATMAAIHIDDGGPGIPLSQRAAVLEPFARLETSRSRDTGGAGLGLAIVRVLVDAHGGQIAFSRADDGWHRVTVCLPLFSA